MIFKFKGHNIEFLKSMLILCWGKIEYPQYQIYVSKFDITGIIIHIKSTLGHLKSTPQLSLYHVIIQFSTTSGWFYMLKINSIGSSSYMVKTSTNHHQQWRCPRKEGREWEGRDAAGCGLVSGRCGAGGGRGDGHDISGRRRGGGHGGGGGGSGSGGKGACHSAGPLLVAMLPTSVLLRVQPHLGEPKIASPSPMMCLEALLRGECLFLAPHTVVTWCLQSYSHIRALPFM